MYVGEHTNVDLQHLSIGSVHCTLRDLGNRTLGQMDVGQQKGLQIPLSRRHTSTAQFPLGNELFTKFRIIVKLVGHLLNGKFGGVEVLRRIPDKLCDDHALAATDSLWRSKGNSVPI